MEIFSKKVRKSLIKFEKVLLNKISEIFSTKKKFFLEENTYSNLMTAIIAIIIMCQMYDDHHPDNMTTMS